MSDTCPLCGNSGSRHFFKDRQRAYYRCERCKLVFVPPEHHLPANEEKAHYDLHENSPGDQGYRRFLGRLLNPMLGRISVGAKGLDFGSGPGPTLSVMFAEAGFEVEVYDIFYAPNQAVLEKNYDFITATEVVEHLSSPGEVLNQLWQMLNPGGILGIMTKRVRDKAAFAHWHYKNDPTHIAFFADDTFTWLAEYWGADIVLKQSDVVLLKKLLSRP